MVTEGSFPFAREEIELEGAPRVGDGVILLDADARIRYASPNSVSSLHRMGIHAYTSGVHLAEIGFDEGAVDTAVRARMPVIEEVERDDASILLRVIPLLEDRKPAGALILLRDVTDLRRRDRMLMSKDATIREIHHRVKNNLQTIAALLRLQGRRLDSPEARQAIKESERRIRSIAIVHETLSREAREEVEFSDIVKPLVRVVEESGVDRDDSGVRFEVDGDAGELPGEVATSAGGRAERADAERGRPRVPSGRQRRPVKGLVIVRRPRREQDLLVEVIDDGVGLPEGFSLENAQGLGLSIVQALVTGELGGTIEFHREEGTRVEVRDPPGRDRRDDGGGTAGLRPGAGSAGALLGQPALAELAALFLGRATPDAGFLVRRQGELQALGVHGTHRADLLGGIDLVERDAGGADGEEQLGVRVATQRTVPPGVLVPVVGADPGEGHPTPFRYETCD